LEFSWYNIVPEKFIPQDLGISPLLDALAVLSNLKGMFSTFVPKRWTAFCIVILVGGIQPHLKWSPKKKIAWVAQYAAVEPLRWWKRYVDAIEVSVFLESPTLT